MHTDAPTDHKAIITYTQVNTCLNRYNNAYIFPINAKLEQLNWAWNLVIFPNLHRYKDQLSMMSSNSAKFDPSVNCNFILFVWLCRRWWGYGGWGKAEQHPPKPDDFFQPPTQIPGDHLRENPLPRRIRQRGAGQENRIERSKSSGKPLNF